MTEQDMIHYADDPFMAEALTYVYIAQYVRPDGPERAGVLAFDCQRYSTQIKQLLSTGDVQGARWGHLDGFVTTGKGIGKAQTIIRNRLAAHRTRLESELGKIPPRCLQYFQDGIFANDGFGDEGRLVQIGKEIRRYDLTFSDNQPRCWCLLSNKDIRDMRDRLFHLLTELKLMAKAHDYVGTREGETREYLYVPAQELQSFFRDYLATVGRIGFLWQEELEEMHSVYHILDSSNSRLYDRDELDRRIPVRYRESVNEFINECLTRNVLTESNSNPARPCLTVNDIVWYDTERGKRYQRPLLDFLLGRTQSGEEKGGGGGGGGGGPSDRDRLLACFATGNAVRPPDQGWLTGLASTLQSILDELGIPCVVGANEFQWGPRVVRANVKPLKGLRINKISGAASDIANRLFARGDLFKFDSDDEVPKSVLIESVPAKGMVGIHIPRNDFVAVPIGELIRSLPKDNPLSFPVGLNVIGQPQFSDLDSMPHLLVAGQPGAGKSVFLNSMIVSLALQNEPSQLQFVLIDPKSGLEFGPYERLPHVVRGQMVISPKQTVDALTSEREDMETRYSLMREAGKSGRPVRKIQEYNKVPGITPLPYRVIMIDEFAALALSSYGALIVELVQALAQKGRAAGFYMVICTQRPSVKVIHGDIKAVVPSRISFRLPTGVDSKVILDEPGAEALLGKGDMFVKETTHPELRRFQGPFVTNDEIDKFVKVAEQIWGSGHA